MLGVIVCRLDAVSFRLGRLAFDHIRRPALIVQYGGRHGSEAAADNFVLVVTHPTAALHLLLVPKNHIRSINDLSDGDRPILAEMLMVAKEMAARRGVAKSGYRLFFNVERGGGQVIFHLHLHLIGG